MLEIQRHRGAPQLYNEIAYTRKWMWAHLILGAVIVAVFLFQEVFGWFAGAAIWYALTLVVMYGFMVEHQICRYLLAVLLLTGAGAGVFFTNRIFPGLTPPRIALIPQALVPILVGLSSISCAVTALVLLFNTRVRRAGRVGFSLW